jgi:hypothetical protein
MKECSVSYPFCSENERVVSDIVQGTLGKPFYALATEPRTSTPSPVQYLKFR